MQLNWVFLLVASFASLAACRHAEFINPPPFTKHDDGFRKFGNNQRYKQGEVVDVILSEIGDVGDLSVWQLNTAGGNKWQETKLDVTKQSKLTESTIPRRYHWKAMYDIGHYMHNGEDAVYWFDLRQNEYRKELYPGEKSIVKSAFFNVSMPDTWKPKRPVASKTTSLVQESATTKPSRKGGKASPTKKPSRKEGKARQTQKPYCRKGKESKKSGLTGAEVAGITIGAIAAFALMIFGFCWGFDRMRVAKQLQKSHEFELRNMERDVRALRETVSKLGA